MISWDDIEQLAVALPEVEEGTTWGNRCWKVKGKTFVWVRPLGKKDRAELGDAAPEGEIAGLRVGDAEEKASVIAMVDAAFTIDHFKNYDAILVSLDEVDPDEMADLLVDAWLCMAPARLADAYATEHGLTG
ncbi:MAG: MmcQ/YjbR family DNA-binding protein [Acidimicrobiales bacterium]